MQVKNFKTITIIVTKKNINIAKVYNSQKAQYNLLMIQMQTKLKIIIKYKISTNFKPHQKLKVLINMKSMESTIVKSLRFN